MKAKSLFFKNDTTRTAVAIAGSLPEPFSRAHFTVVVYGKINCGVPLQLLHSA